MNSMKDVGIYRKAFPRVSETFIQEQSLSLTRYHPTFITCQLVKPIPQPCVALSEIDFWKVKQAFHILTTSARSFKAIEHLRKLALIHAHFGPDGIYAMRIAEQFKIPLIVTFHGHDITVSRKAMLRSGKIAYYQFLRHENELKQKASLFIAVSDYIRKKLIEFGYPPDKVILHYIGIDTQKFSPSTNIGEERYILCVGRHTPKKGIDTLLRAFARIAHHHPDVSLVQVGTGEMSHDLHTLAQQLGIEHRVRFLGAQSYDVVQNLMRNATIFALPSQMAEDGNSEGLPFVILEASASGIPVVSTWHSGIPEAVLNEQTGFLVPEKNDELFAEKLNALLEQPGQALDLGRQGRSFVCEHFDIRKQSIKLEALYDKAIAR
ncbi:glycosyltransferase [Leptolyngbya sp. GB1-A1]|uniref:glycosyltransferase n=2 Tax=Leptolyngbya TaxID=47251 RepID=UPI003296EE03